MQFCQRKIEFTPCFFKKTGVLYYLTKIGGYEMSNIWHDISPKRINPEDFVCVIEIPMGSKNKYELDKETGLLSLDRILYTSTHYPANYGFIPRTFGDDQDPLDVLLLCSQSIEPMTLVRAYPIGMISMIDNGRNDEKIIAIPFSDPTYNQYTSIDQLPAHVFDEMRHFFTVYKNLENKDTAVKEVCGREDAIEVIKNAIDSYIEHFCK
jgi:inorganic pyrophosphatase